MTTAKYVYIPYKQAHFKVQEFMITATDKRESVNSHSNTASDNE